MTSWWDKKQPEAYTDEPPVSSKTESRDMLIAALQELAGKLTDSSIYEAGISHASLYATVVREAIAALSATDETPAPLAVECPYCKRPADEEGGIWHVSGCAGLEKVEMNRLQYDALVARGGLKTSERPSEPQRGK